MRDTKKQGVQPMKFVRNKILSLVLLITFFFLLIPPAGAQTEADIPLATIKEYVKNAYVGPLDKRVLQAQTVEELFELLGDQHSGYMSPKEFEDFRISTYQEYAGVGMQLRLEDEYATVTKVFPGTPAARAGVAEGDQIEIVDGEAVRGWDLDEVVSLIRGMPGTSVMMQLRRTGQAEPVLVTLSRELIHLEPLEDELLTDDIGYIVLDSFTPTAGDEFQAAVDRLLDQGMRALVLDLRQNPGGYLSAALDIGSIFIADKAHLLHVVGKDEEPVTYQSLTGALDIPLAVLVDGYSASAAEIVAGIVQDHGVGAIIGTTTFGKASVQTIFPLPDGGAVKLTTARYLTPKERDLNGSGLVPDQVVADWEEQLPAALAYVRGELAKRPVNTLVLSGQGGSWNGEKIALQPAPYETAGQLMVPLRNLGELFGAVIDWDGTKNQVRGSIDGKELLLTPGTTEASVNGSPAELSSAPVLQGGRVYLPVRTLAELLGLRLQLDAASGAVTLTQ